MSRRRRDTSHLARPTSADYTAAFRQINVMEAAVIWRTVSIDWTADELLYMLWPAEIIDKLKWAYPYTSRARGKHTVELPQATAHQLTIDTGALNCLYPDNVDPVLQMQHPKWESFNAAMNEIVAIRERHNTLRAVVRWFNKHGVTYGCARFNAPWLMSLLDKDHPIHEVSGETYKHTEFPQDILQWLREAPVTVATGLLADPLNSRAPEDSKVFIAMGRSNVVGDYNSVAII